jgi:hypothetical protein
MLKKAVVCILLAAAAAMAWLQLEGQDVPVQVEHGTRLAWGNGRVWGLFPVYGGGNGPTYVLAYDPSDDPEPDPDSLMWDTTITPMSGQRLLYTSLTFQWEEKQVPWGIGDHEGLCRLYWLPENSGTWSNRTIDQFALDDGASIAFVPNASYDVWGFAIPGWIYCYPGGDDTTFWRYAVPAVTIPDIALYGYYPGPGAVIADQTPPFQWGSTATPTYRLLVSTQPDFSDTVIDEQVSSPEYEPTTELDDGTYYWRTAAWVSSAWSWSGTHNFELQGGWQARHRIPLGGHDGSIIAYDHGSFVGNKSILALVNGMSSHDYFYRYDIAGDAWYQEDSVPKCPPDDSSENYYLDDGVSLTTSAPYAGVPHIMAAFQGEGNDDNPWSYKPEKNQGYRWDEWDNPSGDPYWNSHFPRTIGGASSMVMGTGNNMYLLPGFDGDEDFYIVEPPDTAKDGGEAGVSQLGGSEAHTIVGHDGIEVEYQLPAAARVRATLHDAVGRQVRFLDAGEQKAGLHRLSWDSDSEGRKLSAGAYFVLLDVGAEQVRLKAVVR